jgi:hypothetical protein
MLTPLEAGLASSWSAFFADDEPELDDLDEEEEEDDLLPTRAAMLALAKASRVAAIRTWTNALAGMADSIENFSSRSDS